MKLKHILLGLALLFTGADIHSQLAIKHPTNTRFIGGGYNDSRPYFKTLRAALNDVKALATAANPYTFWIMTDTLHVADWDSVYNNGLTMSDSIEVHYRSFGKIHWGGLEIVETLSWELNDSLVIGTATSDALLWNESTGLWQSHTKAAFIDTLEAFSNVINVKTFGATGDGATNDKTSIDNAFTALLSAGGGKLYFPYGTYLYAGQLNKNLDSKVVYIDSDGATIILDDTTSGYSIKDTAGIWVLYNGDILSIQGIIFKATNHASVPQVTKDSSDFLSALYIHNFNKVILNNVEVDSAIYAGALIRDISSLTITNSRFYFNHYAGLLTNNNRQTTIVGNEFSYNGLIDNNIAWGYGLTLSHRAGLSIDNNSVYVAGNKAFYNYRKGLDAHGGHNMTFVNNHVKGYANTGISIINRSGSDPDDPAVRDTSWYMWARNVKVNYNIIENDSLWLDSLSGVYTLTQNAIIIGSNATHVLAGGSIEVIGNIIYDNNSPISQRAPIFIWINTSGEKIDAIKIKDNIIIDVIIDTANYNQEGVINVVSGTVVPGFVDISNNIIQGMSYNGIRVSIVNASQATETTVRIDNNDLEGAFTFPYYSPDEFIVASGNTHNHFPVENLIGKYIGTYNLDFLVKASADSAILATWDVSSYLDKILTYDIHIVATNATSAWAANYDFYATLGDDGGTPFFTAALYDSVGFKGFALGNLPTISWTNSDADNGVLKIHASALFTRYSIFIKISSRGIPIWNAN